MRAAKYRLLIALSSGNALQNPYGPLSRSTHYLFATPQLRSRISKDGINIILGDQQDAVYQQAW